MAEEMLEYSYEDFPASKAGAEGMKTIDISREEVGVCYEKDIIYITRNHIDLSIQLLIPVRADGIEEIYPCIALIQGSGWKKQNTYFNLPQMASFAKRGYVIASIEYRPSDVAPLPAQVQDVKTAIRFLRMNAESYKIDQDNISVWGDSSGGHCALLVGMTEGIEDLDTKDYNDYSASVNAIVDFYGPTDLFMMGHSLSAMDHVGADSPEGIALGGKNVAENKDLSDTFAPIYYVTKDSAIPPIFIVHGNKDRTVPFEQSTVFAQKLKDYNKDYVFYRLNKADHGGPQFWAEELLALIDEFLKQHTK